MAVEFTRLVPYDTKWHKRLKIISFHVFSWKLWPVQSSWMGSQITSRLNSTLAQSMSCSHNSMSCSPSRAPGLPWSQASSTFQVRSTPAVSPHLLIGVGLVLPPSGTCSTEKLPMETDLQKVTDFTLLF